MKLRIIKKHNIYYPQVRFFGIWTSILENRLGKYNNAIPVERYSLKDAEKFIIEEYIKNRNELFSVVREYRLVEYSSTELHEFN